MPIFKAYDVRGVYPTNINEDIMYKIGRAFADFTKAKKIMIAQDMRVSSPSLTKAAIKGITEQGADVIDVGLCSTPMSYFGSAFTKTDAALMVTASHNPPQYNGCKFMGEEAIPISGDTGIKDIEKMVENGEFKKVSKKGKVIKKDIRKDYVKHVMKFVKKVDKLKVVVDCANGMGCLETELILKKLPIKLVEMYSKIDGRFPNHEADPLKAKNTVELQKRVVKEKADLGISFDGDADRVFFIDENGKRIESDFITCIIAKKFLLNKKEKILYDLRSSWVVEEEIKRLGGKAYMSRVGHAFIKAQLREKKAIFGGELSGHFYFKDNFYADSAIIAALKVIEIVSATDMNLSDIIKPLRKYFKTPEINSEVYDKGKKMEELSEIYKDGKISLLDGIRIDFDDWWFNVRPSNTESLLRLNLEAKTKELMEQRKEEVLAVIRSKEDIQEG